MNARRRIYLMRHGAVDYFDASGRPLAPAGEVWLTPEGRAQARAAGRALRDVRIDRVITSGLPRTVETAELVTAELETPPTAPEPEHWPELEELRGGPLEAIPDNELEDAFLAAFRGVAPFDATFTGGETIGELLDRVLPAVQRLCADDSWRTVLLVLHGGVNRAILSWALAGEPTFFGHLEQSPACINVVDVGARGPSVVRAVNVTPYDPAHRNIRVTTIEEMLLAYRPSRDKAAWR